MYWTDFVGYGSKVVSSNLDGEERIKHVEKKGSWFWKVAAYMVRFHFIIYKSVSQIKSFMTYDLSNSQFSNFFFTIKL